MTEQTQDDGAWVAAAQAGDTAAFDRIMVRYRGPVVDFCYRMTGRPDDAVDLAQDTFVRAWRAMGRYRARPDAAFSTWLFQIARNACLDWRRRNRRDPLYAAVDPVETEDLPGPGSVPDAVSARETGACIAAAVLALPEDQRTALVLAEYEGQSHEQIATVLKTSAKAVESRLYRARRSLRHALADKLKT